MSNEQVEDVEELHVQEPGATIMWFGKFEGTRLDQLTDNYRWTMYRFSLENSSQNCMRFREVHEEYMSWLDERQSPLSTTIWFGKYVGYEIRVLYTTPRRWRWLIRNCTHWAPALKNIAERYRVYRLKHPRERPIYKDRLIIANLTGKSLGPIDDGLDSDNDESYDLDDDFVVRSDEGIEYDEGDQSDPGDLPIEEEEQDEEMVQIPSGQFDINADNSEDSLPSLGEIIQSSPAKKTPNKSKHGPEPYFMRRSRLHATSPLTGSSPSHPQVLSSSDDDDELLISPFTRAGKRRIVVEPDSNSESRKTPRTLSDCIVVGGSSQTPSRTNNTPSTTVVISSDSDTDNEANESRNQKSRPSPANTKSSMIIDSDDEPLVPKLRREMMARKKL
ncbi:hypothetical protein K449DRAFT_465959 [Hypoxylon sp. EC38]|nr:hypothetical protein K449DRAFT_465959 [Hypoxylon sp. EC38]